MAGLEAAKHINRRPLRHQMPVRPTGPTTGRQEWRPQRRDGWLPAGVEPPSRPGPAGEIVRYVLRAGYTTNQLKAVQDWVLNPLLKQVKGVIDVTGYGGRSSGIKLTLDTGSSSNTADVARSEAIAGSRTAGGTYSRSAPSPTTNPGRGALGGGKGPAGPGNVSEPLSLKPKLDDIRDVAWPAPDGTPVYVNQCCSDRRSKPPWGSSAAAGTTRRVEGIVLMPKSLHRRTVAARWPRLNGSNYAKHDQVFNQRTELVYITTHNVRPTS
jgi:cobalt-zinc-cadmium resistance protein CzcA